MMDSQQLFSKIKKLWPRTTDAWAEEYHDATAQFSQQVLARAYRAVMSDYDKTAAPPPKAFKVAALRLQGTGEETGENHIPWVQANFNKRCMEWEKSHPKIMAQSAEEGWDLGLMVWLKKSINISMQHEAAGRAFETVMPTAEDVERFRGQAATRKRLYAVGPLKPMRMR